MSRVPEVAVVSSIPLTAYLSGIPNGAASLAIGLVGVVLARTVFVDRENRRNKHHQTIRETLPLTLVAMIVAGAIISDNDFGLSKSAFTGLGVGWTAVLLLDVIGERVLNLIAPTSTKIADMRDLKDIPESMQDTLDLLDQITTKGDEK